LRKHSISFGLKNCIARVRLSVIPSEVEESLTIFC
jgi:hypothetical protein